MKETLNLLPRERIKRRRGLFFYAAVVVGIYLTAMSSLYLLNLRESKLIELEIHRLSALKSDLINNLSAGQTAPPPVITTEKEIADVVKKIPPWDLILGELSVVVPEKVWLNFIEMKESSGVFYMNIKGLSKTQMEVAGLVSGLEESPYFSDVEIIFSQKGQKDTAFELKVKLQWT